MTRPLTVLVVLALSPAAAAGDTESFWLVQAGDFQDPANWDGPVPDGSVTAVFDLDLEVGPFVEFDADAVSDRIVIRAGQVWFGLFHFDGQDWLASDYNLLSPTVGAASVVVAEQSGDVAGLEFIGGSVIAQSMVVGLMPGASGTVELHDFLLPGTELLAHLFCNGLLHVGSGGDGLMQISEQSTLFCDGAALGVQDGAYGEVVLDQSSVWTVANQLTIGKQGQGQVTVDGLGDLASGSAIVGQSPGSIGAVSLSGQGATWTIDGSLDVGFQGQGTMYVSSGAAVFTHGFATIGTMPEPQFPPAAGGTGQVTVIGPVSLWLIDGDLHVGFLWEGSLDVLFGATVTSLGGTVGASNRPGVVARIEGPGSAWSAIEDVTVFAPALLRVADGGLLIADHLVLSSAELEGDGDILADLQGSGTIRVGDPIGTLAIDGAFNFAGVVELELAGPASFDRLTMAGHAIATGSLAVSFAEGYVPQAGHVFEVLVAYTLEVSQLDLNLPALPPDLMWLVLMDSESLTLMISALGDINSDGVVGIEDFLGLLKHWGPCPPGPGECPSDLDGDGSVGVTDFLIVLNNWS